MELLKWNEFRPEPFHLTLIPCMATEWQLFFIQLVAIAWIFVEREFEGFRWCGIGKSFCFGSPENIFVIKMVSFLR